MISLAKTKEKPSVVSKNILRTHHKNGTESFLLTEKIKTLEHKQSQKNIDIDLEVDSLRKKIEAVQRVKEKISLSKERRMLLKSQGFTIRVFKDKEEENILLKRDSLQVEAGNWATLLASPPDFSAVLNEIPEFQSADEPSDDCSSPSERRSNEKKRSLSFSSVADNRPTQVSRYRVIEPPLRPGSRRGFSLVSTASTLKTEGEMRQEQLNDALPVPTTARASTQWNVIRRSIFVDSVIAAKEHKDFACNKDATQLKMQEYWRSKFKAGRRTKSAMAKVRSTINANRELKPSDQTFNNNELKHLLNLKQEKTVGLIEQKETAENNESPQSNLISRSLSKANKDQQDSLCLPSASSTLLTSKEGGNDASAQDYKDETKDLKYEKNMENGNEVNQVLINNDHRPNKMLKSAHISNELPPLQTSNTTHVELKFDVINPFLLNEQEVVCSEGTDAYQSFLKNKKNDSTADLDASVQEYNDKTHPTLLDKISRMSIRRHSADSGVHHTNIFHGNDLEVSKRYPSKDGSILDRMFLQPTRTVSNKLIDRRLSHPPQIIGIQGGEKLRRKSLKDMDEVVYAYDARPDKSLAKGYKVMQMTVGGRQVKLNMAAFPKESEAVNAGRARIHTKLSFNRGKIKDSEETP